MYHEEKIIDGVLCWRGTPDGEWTQKTAKQLTDMLIEARRRRLHTTIQGDMLKVSNTSFQRSEPQAKRPTGNDG